MNAIVETKQKRIDVFVWLLYSVGRYAPSLGYVCMLAHSGNARGESKLILVLTRPDLPTLTVSP